MQITKKLKNQLILLAADIGAQAHLITMGATEEKDKLLALLDQHHKKLEEAEELPDAPRPVEAAYDH